MHILVSNDDGPPSHHSSPYVHCLVRALEAAGHVVSVCLPNTQRSWIGKAHMVGKTVKPSYYRPAATAHGPESQGTTHHLPAASAAVEEWILVDGTPASCVQIGLNHFFSDRGPVDLVVSGPNYGRNSTAVFSLSSGTLGAALEAAACGQKSIALSFAFFTRNHDPVIIEGACRHSVRVIESLYRQWPTDRSADLYSVNVPLVENVGDNKTIIAPILQNYWSSGSCFEEVEGSVGDGEEEEEQIREGLSGEVSGNGEAAEGYTPGHRHKHFKWAPNFTDVYKSVDEAGPGSDGWLVKEGITSVTPLKANFWHAAQDTWGKELALVNVPIAAGVPGRPSVVDSAGSSEPIDSNSIDPVQSPNASKAPEERPLYAIVAYEDSYVQPLLLSALESLFPNTFTLLPFHYNPDTEPALAPLLPAPDARVLQITPYEAIDFEYVAEHPSTCLANSYMIRKALIRKHFLASTVEQWVAKKPDSVLKTHVKRSEGFELDFAEFLDDALVEAWDLRESLEKNDTLEAEAREWWILKPSMSDRAQGIRLFSTLDELQGIFDEWEPPSDDDDDDDDDEETGVLSDQGEDGDDKGPATRGDETDKNNITTSHLRHFVAQPYIHPPFLLPSDPRKFHIRTYVLCVGRLDVYVYTDMLALFAAKKYVPPWAENGIDLDAHLTNTCLQGPDAETNSVERLRDLPIDEDLRKGIVQQISDISGEIFEAAARVAGMHFQPNENSFEVFGLDFLVDGSAGVWLLEVNAFPDFRQTGEKLRGVVDGFWREVLRIGAGGFFGLESEAVGSVDMVLVRRVGLGA